jgi:nitrogen fixation protein NifB
MPLVSAPEHGTAFGLAGRRGPTPEELEAVQRACGGSKVMRHCRACRADAVGLVGEDRNAEFALARLPPEPVNDLPEVRAAYRAAVAVRRARAEAIAARSRRALAAAAPGARARVAVATKGGGLVNEHFGHAREFLVYDVAADGAALAGVRKVERYCAGGEGEDRALGGVLAALRDCDAVLVARIGRCPREALAAAGIEPVDGFAHQPIEAAALGWLAARAPAREVA